MSRSKLINPDDPTKKEGKFNEDASSIFEKPRKKVDTEKDKYRTFKIQNEIYKRFEIVADKKEIRYPGEIIHAVLREWLEKNDYWVDKDGV